MICIPASPNYEVLIEVDGTGNIDSVVSFLTHKNPSSYPTNWYCDDDWLMYTKNEVGADGKENPNPPLAAEKENWKSKRCMFF